MIGKLVSIACAISTASSELSTTACREDSQCFTGFYCDQGLRACRQCMKCEDLMRADLGKPTDCVKSQMHCGPCLQGLTEESLGDLGTKCVHQGSLQEFPFYVWIVLGVAALLLTISIAVMLLLMRTSRSFKMFTSSRTTLQMPAAPALLTDAPPAYSPTPPSAPLPPTVQSPPIPIPAPIVRRFPPFDDSIDGTQCPFIKPVHQMCRREVAGNQEARVFNYPNHVRGMQVADSPESYDDSVVGETFSPLDEATTASVWARDHYSNHSASASPIVTTNIGHNGVEAGESSPPPAKKVHTEQDTNNNGSSGSPQDDLHFTSHYGLPFIINVVKNINTVQQNRDITSNGRYYDQPNLRL